MEAVEEAERCERRFVKRRRTSKGSAMVSYCWRVRPGLRLSVLVTDCVSLSWAVERLRSGVTRMRLRCRKDSDKSSRGNFGRRIECSQLARNRK